MFGKPFKRYQKQYKELYAQLFNLQDRLNDSEDAQSKKQLEAAVEKLQKEIAIFIEDEYAKAVFEYYSRKQPKLIRESTGEVVKWKDAFGNSFEAVPRALRGSLVGIVEGGGRYRLK